MIYLLLPSEEACMGLSESMWRLATPITHGYAQSATKYAVGWAKHPSRNEWVLMVPEDFSYPRHPFVVNMLTSQTDEWGSQALMAQQFLPIAANGMSSLTALAQYVIANDFIVPAAILQFINPAMTRTVEQMIAGGWFTGAL